MNPEKASHSLQSFQDELERQSQALAEQLTEIESGSAQKLLPERVYKERYLQEISSSIDSFKKTIQTGTRILFAALVEIAALHPDAITKEAQDNLARLSKFSPSKKAQSIIEKIKNEIGTKNCQEILGISDATIEVFYQAAKYLYEQQRYQDAAAAFQILTLINDKKPLFWLAYGNSEYFCHAYKQALIAYAIAAYIDPFDPTFHLYSCKCYEELQEIDNAINALDLALIAIGSDTTQKELIQKIHEEKKRLSQKINKES